ncbi:MAG: hypothetical protein ACXVA9_05810 [Bdellovibrionales bacterium]
MRFLALSIAAFCCASAFAEQCGLYQIEDYGERTAYTIIDFVSMNPQQVSYQITNRDSRVVRSMVNGLCYCVDGAVTPDPLFHGDLLYQLLEVTRVTSGPSSGCAPIK